MNWKKDEDTAFGFPKIPGTNFREHISESKYSRTNFREQIFWPGFREEQREILDLVPENGNGKIMVFSTNPWIREMNPCF